MIQIQKQIEPERKCVCVLLFYVWITLTSSGKTGLPLKMVYLSTIRKKLHRTFEENTTYVHTQIKGEAFRSE